VAASGCTTGPSTAPAQAAKTRASAPLTPAAGERSRAASRRVTAGMMNNRANSMITAGRKYRGGTRNAPAAMARNMNESTPITWLKVTVPTSTTR